MLTAEEEHSHWPKIMWKLGQEAAALERQGSRGVCLKAQEQSQAAIHLSVRDMSSPPHHALDTGICETGANAIFFFFFLTREFGKDSESWSAGFSYCLCCLLLY